MLWFVIGQVIQVLMDVLSWHMIADRDKDLEVLVLRQQIRILERRLGKQVRASRIEKLLLALSALQIKVRVGQQRFKNRLLLFKPATVLKWHRDLVKCKWTFQRRREKVGRPRIAEELEALIVRLAKEHPRSGYEKLQGELEKLGDDVGISTVRDVLKRHHILPAPERDGTHSTLALRYRVSSSSALNLPSIFNLLICLVYFRIWYSPLS